MEKKTYIRPVIKALTLQTHAIICTSTIGFGSSANKNTTVDSKERGIDSDNVENGWVDGLW